MVRLVEYKVGVAPGSGLYAVVVRVPHWPLRALHSSSLPYVRSLVTEKCAMCRASWKEPSQTLERWDGTHDVAAVTSIHTPRVKP